MGLIQDRHTMVGSAFKRVIASRDRAMVPVVEAEAPTNADSAITMMDKCASRLQGLLDMEPHGAYAAVQRDMIGSALKSFRNTIHALREYRQYVRTPAAPAGAAGEAAAASEEKAAAAEAAAASEEEAGQVGDEADEAEAVEETEEEE